MWYGIPYNAKLQATKAKAKKTDAIKAAAAFSRTFRSSKTSRLSSVANLVLSSWQTSAKPEQTVDSSTSNKQSHHPWAVWKLASSTKSEIYQEPTRFCVSHLKSRALKQLINKPKQLKQINPPTQATQQHQLQVLQITQNVRIQDKYSRVQYPNSTSMSEHTIDIVDVMRKGNGLHRKMLMEEEREAK